MIILVVLCSTLSSKNINKFIYKLKVSAY